LGAPAETAICEFGPGQFEINLGHTADALAGADHMIWLKRAIRGTARAQKLDATFMAKPFGAASGSGQHIHVSLMDDDAHNALAGVPGQGVSPRLGQAVAGLVTTMAEATAVFAPHANSYRRFVAGSYAPTSAAWGLDNRSTAVRVPATHGPGARIEHRVAGADANPYLLAAAVIAAMLEGIEATRTPPPPTIAGAPASDDQPLPLNWERAIAAFTESAFIGTWLGQEMQRVFAGIKRQEHATLLAQVPDTEYNAYLRVV
ncbi:MAG: glutamine synthetase family protein, partial [Pseudomonadota bacterium]